VSDHFYVALLPYSAPFGIVFLMLLLLRKGEVYRIAIVGLITLVIGPPTTSHRWRDDGHAEAGGRPVANLESNDGQYTFLGRLTEPVTQLHSIIEVKQWSAERPDGLDHLI
jgi:hypothetical protein